jgi:sulfide dehydrogenase cytochrome subunit
MPAPNPISDSGSESAFAVIVTNQVMRRYCIQTAARRCAGACALAMLLLCSNAAHAHEPDYVRGMAATCTNCHSVQSGNSSGMPVIAGRTKSDLLQQLKGFKSGALPATVMHHLARGFSDEQLDLLAGYFAGLKAGSAGAQY